MEPFVKISSIWIKSHTQLQECFVCDDIIFSEVHTLFFQINGKIQSSTIHLCESCYNEIKKDDAIS